MTEQIEKRKDETITPETETEKGDDYFRSRVRYLSQRLPCAAKALGMEDWKGEPTKEQLDVIYELYGAAAPFTEAADVDDTLGAGMADLVDQERDMEGGGVFGEGGITAGGIFGNDSVATNVYDPGAEQRATSARANRALLGEKERSPLPGIDPKRLRGETKQLSVLSEDRRKKLLEV